MTRAFSAISRMAARVSIEADDDCAVDDLPASAPTCAETCFARRRRRRNDGFQSGNTCGEPAAKDSAAGAAVSGSAPNTFTSGFSALTALADADDQPAAADARRSRRRVGRIFENLEPHRGVAGDEIVIVERVDERPSTPG